MIRTLDELDAKGKKVLVRVDFNVPLKDGKVADNTRIVKALPTIKELLDKGAKRVILVSHLGRPKGKKVPELRMDPVASELEKLINMKVLKLDDCIGQEVKNAIDNSSEKIILLENIRFYPEEKEGNEEFAKKLAQLADVFVMDAFGTAHRNHASTAVIGKFLTAYAGRLLEKEVKFLSKVLENPERPFVAILGGAKVSDKIGVVENLLKKADLLLIAGGMSYTFFKAMGRKIGISLLEEDMIDFAKRILEEYSEKLILPVDNKVAKEIKEGVEYIIVEGDIPDDMEGLDIGPKTIKLFKEKLNDAKMVFWNGPLGVFEVEPFDEGTVEIAKHIASLDAITVVGGGDSVAAINKAKVADKITHISTGGGASLKFIEGKKLPGIEIVKK